MTSTQRHSADDRSLASLVEANSFSRAERSLAGIVNVRAILAF